MHGWGIFPNSKRCIMKKNQNIWKIDLFHQNKDNHQLLLQILVRFLSDSIKYVVSKSDVVALLSALNVELLRVMTIQSTFSEDSFKWW